MTVHPHGFIIAVVDDDPNVLDSLASLLESANHVVRLFPSATALVESGNLPEIDCLISDIGMPVMNGFDLLRVVQTTRPSLPVILITGQRDLLSRSPPVNPGPYRVFRKPFDGEELLRAVGDALRNFPEA